MDKFGIFNLLNSFLSFYEKNKSTFATKKTPDAENANTTSSQKRNEPKAAEKNERAHLPPLQTNMLSTMRSHDEFIKRVQEKNAAARK